MIAKCIPFTPTYLWIKGSGPKARRLFFITATLLCVIHFFLELRAQDASPSNTRSPGVGARPPSRNDRDTLDRESRSLIEGGLDATQIYENNVFGFGAADTFTALRPKVRIGRISHNAQWSFEYGPEFRHYARFSRLDATTQAGGMDLQLQITPQLKLDLTEHFIYAPDTTWLSVGPVGFGDSTRFDPNVSPILTERAKHTYQQAALSVYYKFDYRSELRVETALTNLRFSQANLTPFDNPSLNVYFYHKQSPRSTLTFSYGFSHLEFGRPFPPVTNHQLMAGITANLTRSLTSNIEVGPRLSSIGLKQIVGWSARLDLEQAFSNLRIRAGYARFQGAAGGLGGATNNQSFILAARTALSRKTTLTVSASYFTYQPIFSGSPNLHSVLLSAWLESALSRYLSWFFTYQGVLQSRNTILTSARNYDRVAIGLRALAPLTHH